MAELISKFTAEDSESTPGSDNFQTDIAEIIDCNTNALQYLHITIQFFRRTLWT